MTRLAATITLTLLTLSLLPMKLWAIYDPTQGRWLSRDPLPGAELSQGPNLYGYVANNPINYVDPTGLFLWPWEQPVSVEGGTPQQQKVVNEDVAKILATQRGQELEAQIRGPWYWHGDPKTVHINSDSIEKGNCPGPNIKIDPEYHPQIDTTEGLQNASTDRIIAHELGHAVTGTPDAGPGRMDNVNQNENPITKELGEPYTRTAY